MGPSELTPVRAAAELEPGMAVLVAGCRFCGGRHVHVLFEQLHGDWATNGFFHRTDGPGGDAKDDRLYPLLKVGPAIAQGRLFRVPAGSVLLAKAGV